MAEWVAIGWRRRPNRRCGGRKGPSSVGAAAGRSLTLLALFRPLVEDVGGVLCSTGGCVVVEGRPWRWRRSEASGNRRKAEGPAGEEKRARGSAELSGGLGPVGMGDHGPPVTLPPVLPTPSARPTAAPEDQDHLADPPPQCVWGGIGEARRLAARPRPEERRGRSGALAQDHLADPPPQCVWGGIGEARRLAARPRPEERRGRSGALAQDHLADPPPQCVWGGIGEARRLAARPRPEERRGRSGALAQDHLADPPPQCVWGGIGEARRLAARPRPEERRGRSGALAAARRSHRRHRSRRARVVWGRPRTVARSPNLPGIASEPSSTGARFGTSEGRRSGAHDRPPLHEGPPRRDRWATICPTSTSTLGGHRQSSGNHSRRDHSPLQGVTDAAHMKLCRQHSAAIKATYKRRGTEGEMEGQGASRARGNFGSSPQRGRPLDPGGGKGKRGSE
eukprot:CAMPEP_0113565980 /NCGR_PEP_ID=MMETSP0015_2-20120614/22473_1 /TAXON_ID=2838 /ORGANISM="Odontella" /LENGTH=451 /DNA_ID=CAMNT_0000468227 /DNA_START=94 /DNA_END=1449 /DNA_ORIENTATION=+ /assembly_acc=CAM_ASM_000160